jgi:hypothetical protein
MPLPFAGPVPQLLGKWIGNEPGAMPGNVLVEDVIEDLQYKVVLRAEWLKWAIEQRERWLREGFNHA